MIVLETNKCPRTCYISKLANNNHNNNQENNDNNLMAGNICNSYNTSCGNMDNTAQKANHISGNKFDIRTHHNEKKIYL